MSVSAWRSNGIIAGHNLSNFMVVPFRDSNIFAYFPHPEHRNLITMLAKYTTVLLLLLGAASSAAAEQPPAARRLVSGRNLGSPSDFFNDLLKSAAPALEKAVGHMKFKDYDHHGVKLTNLRTFDFDCGDGCLSGSIKGMRVSIDVHKFSLRLHSRYKAHKIITVQGECDFQVRRWRGRRFCFLFMLFFVKK